MRIQRSGVAVSHNRVRTTVDSSVGGMGQFQIKEENKKYEATLNKGLENRVKNIHQ